MDLKLYEDLLILGLDDKTGEIKNNLLTAVPYGIAGALLIELELHNRVKIDQKNVSLIDNSPTGDKLLDSSIELLKKEKSDKTIEHWIRHFVNDIDNLIDLIIEGLCDKNILKTEEKKILWIIPVERHPKSDFTYEAVTRILIRELVLEGTIPNKRQKALLSLVKYANLVDELFLHDEISQANAIIEDICSDDEIGPAVRQVNVEVSTAIMASVSGTIAAVNVMNKY